MLNEVTKTQVGRIGMMLKHWVHIEVPVGRIFKDGISVS